MATRSARWRASAMSPGTARTLGPISATAALRYYEKEGLIDSVRTAGGQRRFHRDVLRRVSFIRAAQHVGLSLDDIRDSLASLPDNRTPTAADWEKLSRSWRPLLDERIH